MIKLDGITFSYDKNQDLLIEDKDESLGVLCLWEQDQLIEYLIKQRSKAGKKIAVDEKLVIVRDNRYETSATETQKIITKKQLWEWQCPSFNFELDADQILEKALEKGFVTKIGDDQYLYNEDY